MIFLIAREIDILLSSDDCNQNKS